MNHSLSVWRPIESYLLLGLKPSGLTTACPHCGLVTHKGPDWPAVKCFKACADCLAELRTPAAVSVWECRRAAWRRELYDRLVRNVMEREGRRTRRQRERERMRREAYSILDTRKGTVEPAAPRV